MELRPKPHRRTVPDFIDVFRPLAFEGKEKQANHGKGEFCPEYYNRSDVSIALQRLNTKLSAVIGEIRQLQIENGDMCRTLSDQMTLDFTEYGFYLRQISV